METNLLDRMLSSYMTDRASVTVTLQNKIKVSGKIKAFDSYVIMMEKPKREILYRHAISSIALHLQDEVKLSPAVPAPRPVLAVKPSPVKTPVRPSKPAAARPATVKPRPQQPAAPAAPEQNVSNSMKEGLLRWMQEQKAAK
jgi:RNA chaperone Hfq